MSGILLMFFAFLLLRFPKKWKLPSMETLVSISGWVMLLAGFTLTFTSSIETGLVALGSFLVLYHASLGGLAISKGIPILDNNIAAGIGFLIFITGIILSFMVSASFGYRSLAGTIIAFVIVRKLIRIEEDIITNRVLCDQEVMHCQKSEYDFSHFSTDIIQKRLQDVITYNNRGNSYVDRCEYEHAISYFTRANEIDPGYAETHYNLGYTYLKTGNMDLALREYAILETLDEELTDKLRRKIEQDQAIFDQTKAIEANPESPGVGRNYFLRGTAYYNKGQYDRAIDDYSNAIEHDAMFLGWIAEPGHIGWGDETQRQIQLNPETEESFRLDVIKNTHQHQRYPFDYYYRASAYYAKGEYDKAILDYIKTIKIDPDMGTAHYFLAEVYLKTGDIESALEHYEALKRLDENAANELHGLLQEHLTTQRNC